MMFPAAPAWIRIPFVFPSILFSSIVLPLLVPIRPTPKSLFDATVTVAAVQVAVGHTEPLPLNWFSRIRLLLLLTRQLPPHGAAPEFAAFLTETLPSIV